MVDHPTRAPKDFAEHEATYHGFLTLLKVSAAASVISLALLYVFLAR